jgi:hypothetical protein
LWAWVRWPLVVLAMMLTVALAVPAALRAISSSVLVDMGTSPETVEASPASGTLSGPVTDGAAPPLADFVARNGTVAEAQTAEVVLADQPGSAVVMAFPLIPGDPACIGGVFVDLTIRQGTPTELGAYLATAWDAQSLLDGAPVPAQLLATDQPSSIAVTDGTPGRLRWDVTNAYRLFVTGGLAPPESPFVIGISATSVPPGGGVRFAAAEAGPDGPAVSWTAVPGCQAMA